MTTTTTTTTTTRTTTSTTTDQILLLSILFNLTIFCIPSGPMLCLVTLETRQRGATIRKKIRKPPSLSPNYEQCQSGEALQLNMQLITVILNYASDDRTSGLSDYQTNGRTD